MSQNPVRIMHEGDLADADEVSFTGEAVASCSVIIEDGAKLEFTNHLMKVFRLRDKKQADGSAIYAFMGKVETRVTPPEGSGKEQHDAVS